MEPGTEPTDNSAQAQHSGEAGVQLVRTSHTGAGLIHQPAAIPTMRGRRVAHYLHVHHPAIGLEPAFQGGIEIYVPRCKMEASEPQRLRLNQAPKRSIMPQATRPPLFPLGSVL